MTVFLKRQIARSLWNIRNRILVHGWTRAPIVTDKIYYKKINNMLRIETGRFSFVNFMDTKIAISEKNTFVLGERVYNCVTPQTTEQVYLCYSGQHVIPIEKNQAILYPLVVETFKEMNEFIKEFEHGQ